MVTKIHACLSVSYVHVIPESHVLWQAEDVHAGTG